MSRVLNISFQSTNIVRCFIILCERTLYFMYCLLKTYCLTQSNHNNQIPQKFNHQTSGNDETCAHECEEDSSLLLLRDWFLYVFFWNSVRLIFIFRGQIAVLACEFHKRGAISIWGENCFQNGIQIKVPSKTIRSVFFFGCWTLLIRIIRLPAL